MEALLRYRGRQVTAADVSFIRELVAAYPGESRRRLSQKLCEAWGWRQANGAPRDMVARGLMLALSRAGHIELPAVRMRPRNPLATRVRPRPVAVDQTPLSSSLCELGSVHFRQVRRTPEERGRSRQECGLCVYRGDTGEDHAPDTHRRGYLSRL
jgi:hypothetical protein